MYLLKKLYYKYVLHLQYEKTIVYDESKGIILPVSDEKNSSVNVPVKYCASPVMPNNKWLGEFIADSKASSFE